MKEVSIVYIKARLDALGFTEGVIKTGIEDAIEGAKKADAIYFHKQGFRDTVIQMDFNTKRWFIQDPLDETSRDTDMNDIRHVCRLCGNRSVGMCALGHDIEDGIVTGCDGFALAEDLKPGTVWRKEGPGDWIRIEAIQDPALPEAYDGGLPGVSVIQFPFQNHGIQLRGGKQCFIAGADWPEHVRWNRFVLSPGWKCGDTISIADIICCQSRMDKDEVKL
ncbi:MAG: hypothetical protein WAW23_00260 [Candidatus Methanoperedens sp.]